MSWIALDFASASVDHPHDDAAARRTLPARAGIPCRPAWQLLFGRADKGFQRHATNGWAEAGDNAGPGGNLEELST
jgi:hypothetical protein